MEAPKPRPSIDLGSDWRTISTKSTTTRDRRLTIPVRTRAEKLVVQVLDRALFITRLRIRFGNGEVQTVSVGEILFNGDKTQAIRLNGGMRNIQQVVVDLRPQSRRRNARIQLLAFGRAPIARPLPRGWKSMATKRADLRNDRFVLRVGRNKGAFKRINLRSRNNPVFIRRIRIVFGNGQEQVVRVRQTLRAGQETGVINLDGNRRFIREVIVRTRSQSRRRVTTLEMIGEVGRPVANRPTMPRGWKRLNVRNVDLRNERFVIPVGRGAGRFAAIRIRPLDNPIRVVRIRVVFGNTSTQDVRLNRLIRPGAMSDTINLIRRNRYIDKVIVTTRGTNRRRLTRLEVIGQVAGGGRPPAGGGHPPVGGVPGHHDVGNWVSFGQRRADMFKTSTDTFAVGANKGRFTRIRLRVLRHDVRIKRVRVVFGNGEVQEVPIGGRIRDGAYSQTVELQSHRRRGRRVQSVQVRHKTKINFKGEGATEVWLMRN